MTREESLAVWDTIKRLYRSFVRAEADKAALIQLLREALNESQSEVLSRLDDFHEEEFYQRVIHDCEKTLLPIDAATQDSGDQELIQALARLPVPKLVN
jgi:hypothetical protein